MQDSSPWSAGGGQQWLPPTEEVVGPLVGELHHLKGEPLEDFVLVLELVQGGEGLDGVDDDAMQGGTDEGGPAGEEHQADEEDCWEVL